LKPKIFCFKSWSNPLMTLITTIKTATPSITPITQIAVMIDTNVRLGRKYRSASINSKGNLDMGRKTTGDFTRSHHGVARNHRGVSSIRTSVFSAPSATCAPLPKGSFTLSVRGNSSGFSGSSGSGVPPGATVGVSGPGRSSG
jgi:hypothetical protein